MLLYNYIREPVRKGNLLLMGARIQTKQKDKREVIIIIIIIITAVFT